jgi:hypothetical protein
MWGIGAASIGGIAILVAFFLQFGSERAITKVPDLRITIPMLVVAVALGVMSFVKRERLRALPIAGVALAVSACVLGWLIIVAAVAAAAVIAILIIAKVT